MENALTLEEKVKQLIDKKLAICSCNPCTCSLQKKDEYFQELKKILKMLNLEKIRSETQFQLRHKQKEKKIEHQINKKTSKISDNQVRESSQFMKLKERNKIC